MEKKNAIDILERNGITIKMERRVGNYGDKLDLSNGSVVTIYDKGTFMVQGKNAGETQRILEERAPKGNNKVFVVYGHDTISKTQLEAMLRRWDLEPLILDQLPSSGNTIIEKLEEYTKQVEFGIVLATPDDLGYSVNDGEDKKRYRVRQNVVLELGILLASIGRKRVAILLKTVDNFEKPSDIDGLIYIPFSSNVEETKLSLAKEMEKHNYKLNVSKL